MAMTDRIEPKRVDDQEPELNQPELARLRETVANYARKQAPGPPRLRHDGIAGLNSAISSVPDGMASGLLAGVNPVYGPYAAILGPIAGGFFSSTKLMVITTTSAASLMTGQVLSALPPGDRDSILVLVVVLIGTFQIAFGLLGLGRLTRYRSSIDVSLVELVERPDGEIEERKPAEHLRSDAVTVLYVYGH